MHRVAWIASKPAPTVQWRTQEPAPPKPCRSRLAGDGR